MLIIYLGILHSHGQGKLVHQDCDVKFHWLIPQDLKNCPYLVFISYGTHTHPPPPPDKLPKDIVNDLTKLIMDCRLESFQLRKYFLRSLKAPLEYS